MALIAAALVGSLLISGPSAQEVAGGYVTALNARDENAMRELTCAAQRNDPREFLRRFVALSGDTVTLRYELGEVAEQSPDRASAKVRVRLGDDPTGLSGILGSITEDRPLTITVELRKEDRVWRVCQ
ncbi:hypothetical protein D5S17_08925 [Pseudonocardiaceae bacterium YIM PH 21723]|nr:hypothetical protein D5S17_08925 [Pseudonocardiaceae bacterium YIM PH 21723]